MKVYEAAANAFLKEGTTTIFGLLGDGQMNWWSVMSTHPNVKIIDVREEGGALMMAEGWARASGKTGVCSVTHGPGISRMTTSLICATRSRTPIVVYTSKTAFNNEKNSQFLEQERLVSATGAGYIELLNPGYTEDAVRQAFYRARLEQRPIVLAVPLDIQKKECDSDGDDYQPSSTLFAGQQRIQPDAEALNRAVQIIKTSKKPVMLLGRGAMEPNARDAAGQLANRIGAIITTTLIAKGVLGESEYHGGVSGLFSTRPVMQLAQETDCVIGIGAGLNARTMAGGYLYPNARFVHIDIEPHVLMGNERAADCYVQGDAAVTVQKIDDMLAQLRISSEGYHTAAVRKLLLGKDRDTAEFEIEPGTVDPREAVRVIDERLPSSVGLVTGGGNFFPFPVWHMQKPRPLQIYVTAFGSIGQTLGTAVGVGIAVKDPIVCIEGDGSAMQNIQELETAARVGVKILFVIMNDEAYGAEYVKFKAKGQNVNLSMVPSPDFGHVGRAFGCRGRLARSIEDVSNGVDEFLAGDGPMVLDVRVSRNVINIPVRRVQFGQDV